MTQYQDRGERGKNSKLEDRTIEITLTDEQQQKIYWLTKNNRGPGTSGAVMKDLTFSSLESQRRGVTE